jgi:hypothetical protein
MAVAALVTAIGTAIQPFKNQKYEKQLNNINDEIYDISVDIRKLSENINKLYNVHKNESRRKRNASELEKSAFLIEERIIQEYFEKKLGKKFAKDYIKKRRKYRSEIRSSYLDIQEIDKIGNPHKPPDSRKLNSK